MTHQDVEDQDLVDRYVRRELNEADSEAFEAHFFECDACFAEVRDAERLRQAFVPAAGGHLSPDAPAAVPLTARSPSKSTWTWMPMAASVVLLAGVGWLTLKEVPQLRSEVQQLRAERDRLEASAPARPSAPESPAALTAPEANVPIALLQSERGATAEPAAVSVPATAAHVILWISAPAAVSPVRLIVLSAEGREVARVGGLTRNSSGAYIVSLPSASLPHAIYRLRLVTGADASPVLIGEYLLRVSAAK
jgi:hypothetical protein